MIIKTARLTARVCLTLIGILLIVLALLSAGVRIGLPLVANYKPTIESRLSDYLRSPVSIGDLKLSWEGFGPLLRAEQVAVFESSERKVTLDELLIDLNLAQSVVSGAPVINELTLLGASLAVEADKDGHFRLHGMDRVRTGQGAATPGTPPKGGGVDLMAWLLTAKKVGLLQTRVTLIDQEADLQLVMEDLNIRAENNGDVHQLRVDVQLPEELGGSLEAGIDLHGNTNELDKAFGDLYVKADSLESNALTEVLKVGALAEKLRPVNMPIDTTVSLELWGQWRDGRLVSARGPISTSPIFQSTSGENLADGLSANILVTGSDQTVAVTGSDIILAMGTDTLRIEKIQGQWSQAKAPASAGSASVEGSQSPATSTSEQQVSAGRTWEMSAGGEHLDWSALSRFATGVIAGLSPTSEATNDAINTDGKADALLDQAPAFMTADTKGTLHNWELVYRSESRTPNLTVKGDFIEVSVPATAVSPAFGPLSGRIDVENSVGEIALSATQMPFEWASLGFVPVQLDSLNAVIDVDLTEMKSPLLDADVELQDDGIELSARMKMTLASGQSPHLDMQSRFSAEDVTAIKQWVPRKRVNANFLRWFDRAIQGGSLNDGSILLFGRMADFPFSRGEGVLKGSAEFTEGQLQFNTLWPTATDIIGRLEIDGPSLSGVAQQGRMNSFDVSKATVSIENLRLPVLKLSGAGNGQLQKVIDFGNTGPLKGILRPALQDVTGDGRTDIDLALTLPLYKARPPVEGQVPTVKRPSLAVNGAVFFGGNSVTFNQAQMPLEKVVGSIGFNERGIRVNGLKARMFNRDVRIGANTDGKGLQATTTVTLTGALKANDALAHYDNPLDQFVRGSSNWLAELSVPHSADRIAANGVRMHLQSDLIGTEIMLPEPLSVSSGESHRLVLNTAFRAAGEEQRWDVHVAGKAHASATTIDGELESVVVNVGAGKLWQSAIANPKPGIRILGNVNRFAADDWVETVAQFLDSLPEGESGQQTPIIPVSAELDIRSFILGTESLGAAALSASSSSDFLTATIRNASLSGSLEYPREHWTRRIPAKARFNHVDYKVIEALTSDPESDEAGDENIPLNPQELPPIDAKISRLTHKSKTIRDLVLRAQPEVGGLQVTTLGFAYDTMQLVGQGYWRLKDPQGVNPAFANQHQTRLNLVLQSDDFGTGFSDVGIHDVISKGEGTAEVQLHWPGPIYLPSIDTLDGNIKLNVERGNIIPVEVGPGRLVGLFALQSLPRRLDLDFSDISNDGLAFNRITGDAQIEDGVVDVKLVQFTGPVGVVDIVGESDLNTREIDQTITVLPRISAALPIIGIISGGASGGVGALIATGLLKALGLDFDRIGLREYTLTGTLDEPVVRPETRGASPDRQ